jgi:hypothetical protein
MEKDEQSKALDFLNIDLPYKHGVPAKFYKINDRYLKGIIDIVGVMGGEGHGLPVWIEMKYASGKPSKNQEKNMEFLKWAGAHVFTCWTAHEVKSSVFELLRQHSLL